MALQDEERSNWGADVAPGHYRGMVVRQAWQTFFLIPPGGFGPVTVLNRDIGAGGTPLT